jgi:hypothetical protein
MQFILPFSYFELRNQRKQSMNIIITFINQVIRKKMPLKNKFGLENVFR